MVEDNIPEDIPEENRYIEMHKPPNGNGKFYNIKML